MGLIEIVAPGASTAVYFPTQVLDHSKTGLQREAKRNLSCASMNAIVDPGHLRPTHHKQEK